MTDKERIKELEVKLANESFDLERACGLIDIQANELSELRAENAKLKGLLSSAFDAMKTLPRDIFGMADNGMPEPEYLEWLILDELLDRIDQARPESETK